jgi:predicted Zn finger-like uncharacterized protein
MLIVCPSCASRYSIDDDKIGPVGRTVRCANCRSDFFAGPAEARPAEGAGDAPASQGESASARAVAEAGGAADEAGTPWPAPDDPEETQGAEAPLAAASDELDTLFEQEMEAARLEAEAALETLNAPPQPTGWRRFMPMAALGALLQRFSRPKTAPGPQEAAALDAPNEAEAPLASSGPAPRGRARLVRDKPKAKPPSLPLRLLGAAKGPAGLGLAGCALLALAVTQREALVRLSPASGSVFAAIGLPVNVAGLTISDVTSLTRREGDARLLVIEGRVTNVRSGVTPVPLIEIRIRGEDGRAIYTWTAEPPQPSLKPGEALQFRTRLATPPEAGRDVELRFTDKARSASAGR